MTSRSNKLSENRYFQIRQQNEVTIAQLVDPNQFGRLLFNEVGDELIAYLDQNQTRSLLINFQDVKYCSSEVIGSLVRTHSHIASNDGEMKLCCMKDDIHEIFRITHLEKNVFEIFESEEEAVASFSPN